MPTPDESKVFPDGQLRKWQPETRNLENFNEMGPSSGFQSAEDAAAADVASGQGSWVPAAYGGGMPWWMKAFVATGLGSMAVTGLGALAAPGAFGGAGSAGAAGAGGAGAAGGTSAAAGGTGAAGAAGAGGAGAAGAAGGAGAGSGLGTMGTLAKLGSAGQILSSYAQGAGQGRQAEANLNLNTDALRQRQTESERQDAIDRAKLEETHRVTGQNLESQARSQAAWGQFAQNPGNPFMSADIKAKYGSPDFSGYSGIGADAYRAAQARLLSGSDKTFTDLPTIRTPTLTPQPNESWLDKLARWGGTGLGLAGAIGGYRPPTTGGR